MDNFFWDLIFIPFYCLFSSMWFVLVFGGMALWVMMLVDVAKRPNSDFKHENDKVAWILILSLTSIVGAVVYYFLVKRKLDK